MEHLITILLIIGGICLGTVLSQLLIYRDWSGFSKVYLVLITIGLLADGAGLFLTALT